MLGLHCCVWAFSSGGKQRLLSSCCMGASHCGGFFHWGSQVLEHRFSNCSSQASLPWGMWNLPRPGIEPMCPAWAGEFLSTGPPEKSTANFLMAAKFQELSFPISQCSIFLLFPDLSWNILHDSQILDLWSWLFAAFICDSESNTHGTFWPLVVLSRVSKKLTCLTVHVSSWGPTRQWSAFLF